MFSWTKVWCVLVSLVTLLIASSAFAQKPVLVHVISLDSDDSSDDQADALTAALRSRVHGTPAWQLADSNQSLATLLPALKCPTRPDSACLQRIGDQLKTDRFFWGNVVKAGVPHQVVAEVHLWTRGKPEQVAKENFSDNLKDQNDDALRRVATSLFERLTGQATQGTLIVHAANADGGTVLVDGKASGQIDHGMATILVPSGPHQIDVQAPNMTSVPQSATVVVNVQTEVTIQLTAVAGPVAPSGPSHIKKTIGFITLGAAGASAIVAGVFAGLFAGNASTFNAVLAQIPTSFTNVCTNATQNTQAALFVSGTQGGLNRGCDARTAADTDGSIAWAMTGVAVGLAVVGVVLIITDHGKEQSAPSSRLRIAPTFGPNSGGVSALLTF